MLLFMHGPTLDALYLVIYEFSELGVFDIKTSYNVGEGLDASLVREYYYSWRTDIYSDYMERIIFLESSASQVSFLP